MKLFLLLKNKFPIFYLVVLLISCNSNTTNKEKESIRKVDTPVSQKGYKIISDSTNILENKTQTLELEYTLWGCACPNWITTIDAKKKDDNNFLKRHIYIEAANTKLYFPDSTFDFGKENILVTGKFYKRKDYPQGTMEMEEPIEKAKVFKYDKIKVIKKN